MELLIQGLSKRYPNGIQALNHVSLAIRPGMFGLLGPNGAGKSTLMRTLATLQQADSGTIKLGDIDLLKSPQKIRRLLGYLPQDFGLFPKVSAYDLLDHFARLKGLTHGKNRKETVEELLHRTNLFQARRQNLGGFSGGMRQRFGIAQVLLGNPKLIIVDEPTAGLDPEERARFHNLLADISDEVIVILSTHIVSDVSDLCSNFAIINKGAVLMSGDPKQAIATLEGKVWHRTIDKTELESYKERLPVISARLSGGKTIIRVYSKTAPAPGFTPTEPDLEDIYFYHIHVVRTNDPAKREPMTEWDNS